MKCVHFKSCSMCPECDGECSLCARGQIVVVRKFFEDTSLLPYMFHSRYRNLSACWTYPHKPSRPTVWSANDNTNANPKFTIPVVSFPPPAPTTTAVPTPGWLLYLAVDYRQNRLLEAFPLLLTTHLDWRKTVS